MLFAVAAASLVQVRSGEATVITRFGNPARVLLEPGLGLLVWLLVLQRLEVGIAYPMLSLNFVLVTLVARFVFHEPVDGRHWLGVALVIGGVVLLGRHV